MCDFANASSSLSTNEMFKTTFYHLHALIPLRRWTPTCNVSPLCAGLRPRLSRIFAMYQSLALAIVAAPVTCEQCLNSNATRGCALAPPTGRGCALAPPFASPCPADGWKEKCMVSLLAPLVSPQQLGFRSPTRAFCTLTKRPAGWGSSSRYSPPYVSLKPRPYGPHVLHRGSKLTTRYVPRRCARPLFFLWYSQPYRRFCS